MKSLDTIIDSIREFPTLPSIYLQLTEAMSNPDVNINYITKIIENDTASVSKLLKLANSPIFGFRNRVSSVHQSILYIGIEEVKNLLLSLKIISVFQNHKENINLVSPVEFWEHSIATGVIARYMGSNIGIANSGTLFLGGVLHNIGRLMFYITLQNEYEKVIDLHINEKYTLNDAERKIFGISSPIAGEMLAQKWKLPIQLIDIIKYHYHGTSNDKINLNVSAVHIADIVALMLKFGSDGRKFVQQPNPLVWEQLQFTENFFTTNLSKMSSEITDNCSIILGSD